VTGATATGDRIRTVIRAAGGFFPAAALAAVVAVGAAAAVAVTAGAALAAAILAALAAAILAAAAPAATGSYRFRVK
jgi:hypothetical protein